MCDFSAVSHGLCTVLPGQWVCGLSYISYVLLAVSPGQKVCDVSDLSHEILCFTRSEGVFHGIFSVLPSQRVRFVRHFPWSVFKFHQVSRCEICPMDPMDYLFHQVWGDVICQMDSMDYLLHQVGGDLSDAFHGFFFV